MSLPLQLAASGEAESLEPRLERSTGAVEYPLSLNQQQMWFECQLDLASNLYNVGVRMTIDGDLDIPLFTQAIQITVDRHEILRTIFAVNGDIPVQKVVADVKIQCPIVDLTVLSPTEIAPGVYERLDALTKKTFELAAAPLFRMELLRCAPKKHHFVFVFHHLLVDAFYCGQLLREILAVYERLRGGELMFSPMKFQFGDFCLWQRERVRRGLLDPTVTFWEGQLREPLPEVQLPPDGAAPMPRQLRGCYAYVLDPGIVGRLENIGRQNRTTLFRVVLGAFVLLLTALLETDETMIDIDFSTRPRELNQVIGSFANVLPVRFRVESFESFCDLLRTVDGQLREVTRHRELPVRQLARRLKGRRDPTRPFTSVQVTQLGEMDFDSGELHLIGDGLMNGTVHDLWLTVMQREDKMELIFGYCEELFRPTRVAGWAESFRKLLSMIAANPQATLLELTIAAGIEVEGLGLGAAAF